ncbi:MAG: hypothetical protein IJ386_00095, partial [Clostridia bacterium]|nr:hypothetical protein [Clostridia bacterium]
FDYTCDIYAEWPLKDDEYTDEISRASEIFKKHADGNGFTEIKKGKYNCLILYSGNMPFTKATDNYDYVIFAYNDEENTVRYIYCSSLENGVDQPYYLQLDW